MKAIAVDFGGVYYTFNFDTYAVAIGNISGTDPIIVKKALQKRMKEFHVASISEKEYWNEYCKEIGKNLDHSILIKVSLEQFKPISSTITLLQKLRPQFTIALITNQTTILSTIEKRDHIFKNFDVIVNSYTDGVQKPNSQAFHLLLKRTKTNAEDTLFIDDNPRNCDAAKKLGFLTILYRSRLDLEKEVKKFIAI